MRILVTGGAGFIGSNAVAHYAQQGHEVLVIDNLSRPSSPLNLKQLQQNHDFKFVGADLTSVGKYSEELQAFMPEVILHLAGQVAVTTSMVNPVLDFDGNAKATLFLLEEARKLTERPFLIFASTNKVYGELDEIPVAEKATRYEYELDGFAISESVPLNFNSPYGCSKGSADQYVLEYARSFGVPGVVFRQSCVYGPGQFGIEDQGWIAWFVAAAIVGRTVTVFGDGKQVRDVLHVADLLSAFDAAIKEKTKCSGQAFNIGGGIANTLSVLELIEAISNETGNNLLWDYGPWRPSDQKVFISNVSKAHRVLGWQPSISPERGIPDLIEWVKSNSSRVEEVIGRR
jgi:CDP-paratose 2-epimerase